MRVRFYFSIVLLFCILLISAGCGSKSGFYNKEPGSYPGNPAENFAPSLQPDNDNYRNIARQRPAWNSSSYDYNLTAQLVTDGIIECKAPFRLAFSTNHGVLPRNEREWLLDHNSVTTFSIPGSDVFLRYDLLGDGKVPEISQIAITGNLNFDEGKRGGYRYVCSGSDDGVNWTDLVAVNGAGLPGRERPDPFRMMMPAANQRRSTQARRSQQTGFGAFMMSPYGNDSTAPRPSFSFGAGFRTPRPQRILELSFDFEKPVAYKSYKVSLTAPSAETWTFGDLEFFNGNSRLKMTPSHDFRSGWMSSGKQKEWVYVDLGSISTFDNIKLHWINKAASGSIQISDDSRNWLEIASLPGNSDHVDDIKLSPEVKARYVKLILDTPENDQNYLLSELEVFGRGGLVPVPKPSPAVKDNRMYLSGGNWKIQRSSEVQSSGEELSSSGYRDDGWLSATVPGTVLVSYRNAGALPDPNFGDNQLMISESYFNSDFWYRNEFEVPSSLKGDRLFLNFDGINWKAEVFVNGVRTGNIGGAFTTGRFDVTGNVKPGQKNVLAVLIHKNDNPGVIKEKTALNADKNGGVLGGDNPTYHASIGWDWIPTIRGRNIGIWNDVHLDATGNVTVDDPFISARLNLPDTTEAGITMEVTLSNHSEMTVSGTLESKFGKIAVQKDVSVGPGAQLNVKFAPADYPALSISNPELWWPNGYGRQILHKVEISFKADGEISDSKSFMSGIREMTYTEEDGILNLYVNGRRFIGHGGNWGFPESNLEYRGREYDAAVAYHADMNFTMIRNWVGQTGDDEFYEACDRHGIMVWQDFWLANPADGPDPYDPELFMDNAENMVRRIRNHPSIGLYCGRNEGNPPEVLDTALRSMIPQLHPGIHYISNSSMGVVSGGGPYNALPVRDYFLLYGFNKFHSERGMPNVMNYESLVEMLPESSLWPQNSLWGIHDYCLESAQRAASFNQMIDKAFGMPDNAKRFTELAQWINYNGYRGMFEGRSMYRQGLLLWMSHPAWPSMVWQTYDYYFDPTAAYFGCKKACEPLHIQWNPVYDTIEVVNLYAGDRKGLKAKAQLLNMDGSVFWEKETLVDCREDETVNCFRLEFPDRLTSVHFIRLSLREGDKVVSENFYWRGVEDGNYQALNKLPHVKLEDATIVKRSGEDWIITTTLINSTDTPALMVRLKVVGKQSGKRILPVFFSDNYVSLMPGEKKLITMKFKNCDTRGEKPAIEISGFNL